MKKYDFLIVGSGLFGSVCARELTNKGYDVLVIDKRSHIGGNVFTKEMFGINVHLYGAHIFHTSNKKVWDYVNSFATFNNFINTPIAHYYNEKYHLPFNMNTFVELWDDVNTIEDAKRRIESDKVYFGRPKNLEEQALELAGKTIYKKLIKEYTEKQWGKACKDLPPFIIKRVPLRFEFNNNYFDDTYQGIPMGGYTELIRKMLAGIDVLLNVSYTRDLRLLAKKMIFTGPIDEYFDYCLGYLEYRSLRFEHFVFNQSDYQGNAVVNYTSKNVDYTRTIEHKHFEMIKGVTKTVVTFEFPDSWKIGKERFYTINDERNLELYNRYLDLSRKEDGVFFGGRLGMYRYFDMDDTIEEALKLVERICKDDGK